MSFDHNTEAEMSSAQPPVYPAETAPNEKQYVGKEPSQYIAPPPPPPPQATALTNTRMPITTPMQVHCPYCAATTTTRVKHRVGFKAGALAVGTAFVFWPLFWVPLVVRRLRDVEHVCGQCKATLVTFKA